MKNILMALSFILLFVACDLGRSNIGSSGSSTPDADPPPTLVVSPTSANIALGDSVLFNIEGGEEPYSIAGSTSASMNDQGFYVGSSQGSHSLTIEDSSGQSVEISINVGLASFVTISPSYYYLSNGESYTPTASGGTPPYNWTLNGSGSINSSTGEFTAPMSVGTSVITATDANGLSTSVQYRYNTFDTTNIRAWYRPESLSALSDGDNVTTWVDSSGNGFDLTAPGGNEPSFLASDRGYLSSIEFNGVDQFLEGPAFLDYDEFEVFIVYTNKADPLGGIGQTIVSHCGSFASELAVDNCLFRVYQSSAEVGVMTESGAGLDDTYDGLTWSFGILRFNISGTGATIKSGGSGANAPLNYGTSGTNGIFRVGTFDGTNFMFEGTVSEIILYDTDFPYAEPTIETYLSDKFFP